MKELANRLIKTNPTCQEYPTDFDWDERRNESCQVFESIKANCPGKWRFDDQNQDATYSFSIAWKTGENSGFEAIVFSNFGRFVYVWEESLPDEHIPVIRKILESYGLEVVGKNEQRYLEETKQWDKVSYSLFSYL